MTDNERRDEDEINLIDSWGVLVKMKYGILQSDMILRKR